MRKQIDQAIGWVGRMEEWCVWWCDGWYGLLKVETPMSVRILDFGWTFIFLEGSKRVEGRRQYCFGMDIVKLSINNQIS